MPEPTSSLVEEASSLGATIVSNGTNVDDLEIIDLDIDPLQDVQSTRVAKLTFNAYVKSAPTYNEASGRDARPQWRQEFVDADGNTNDNGDPRMYFNNVNMSFERDGKEVKTTRLGAKALAEAFEKVGVVINPADADSMQYLGQYFRITRITVPLGEYKRDLWVPTEYIGAEYDAPVAEEVQF